LIGHDRIVYAAEIDGNEDLSDYELDMTGDDLFFSDRPGVWGGVNQRR
jgi:hypothetical protein